MALDMFLALSEKPCKPGEAPSLKGESGDKSYKGWIDVLAWSWGISNAGSFHAGGGGGTGKANFNDIGATKWIDNCTPQLMLYCSNGDHFKHGMLVVRKAGKNPLDYLIVTMENVLITSVSTGGSGGEDRLTENLTLNFEKVETKYTEQKQDGSAGKPEEYKWDIKANGPK